VRFVGELQNINVVLADPSALVVINARTGSIVMNRTVTLEAAAVAHGNLSVTITTTPVVSQPGPMSGGQTTVTEKTDISVRQDGGSLLTLPAATSLADLVKALNALGANPGDLVAILQALKASGALRAELEVIEPVGNEIFLNLRSGDIELFVRTPPQARSRSPSRPGHRRRA